MLKRTNLKRFRALMVALAVVVATNFAISVTLNLGGEKSVISQPNPPKPKSVISQPNPPKPRSVISQPNPPKP